MPINHILVLKRIAGVTHGPRFRLRLLETPFVPVCRDFSVTLSRQARNRLCLAKVDKFLLLSFFGHCTLGALRADRQTVDSHNYRLFRFLH